MANFHGEALRLELFGEHLGHLDIVVDHQDGCAISNPH
jgi:hypothetical protein